MKSKEDIAINPEYFIKNLQSIFANHQTTEIIEYYKDLFTPASLIAGIDNIGQEKMFLSYLLSEIPLDKRESFWSKIDLQAMLNEGLYAGTTVLYWLARTPQGRQLLSQQPALLRGGQMNVGPTQGPDAGTTILYWLASCPVGYQLLIQNPALLQGAQMNAGPTQGPYAGTTVLYWLAGPPEGCQLLAQHPALLQGAQMNAGITQGPYAGTTVLYWLAGTPEGCQFLIQHPALLQGAQMNAGPTQGTDAGTTVLYWLTDSLEGCQLLSQTPALLQGAQMNAGHIEGLCAGRTVLSNMAIYGEWDLVLSVLRLKEAEDINLELLYKDEPNRLSVVELAFRKQAITNTFFSNLLIRSFLLASKLDIGIKETLKPRLLNHAQLLIDKIKCTPGDANKISELQTHLSQAVSGLMQLFNEIGGLWEHPSTNSILNQLPPELRQMISQNLLNHTILANVGDSMKTALINCFLELHQMMSPLQAVTLQAQSFCMKLAKLAFREWRHNHAGLLMTSTLSRSTVKDMYEMLSECFLTDILQSKEFLKIKGEKWKNLLQRYRPQPMLPQQLQKDVIKQIAQLEKDNFCKSEIKKLIKDIMFKYTNPDCETNNSRRKRQDASSDKEPEKQLGRPPKKQKITHDQEQQILSKNFF